MYTGALNGNYKSNVPIDFCIQEFTFGIILLNPVIKSFDVVNIIP